MTEQEWLTSNDPVAMLEYLTQHTPEGQHETSVEGYRVLRRASKRKLLLLSVAIWRASGMPDRLKHTRYAYEQIDKDADEQREMPVIAAAVKLAQAWCNEAADGNNPPKELCCNIIRDIFGNPFQSLPEVWRGDWVADWNTATVRGVAQAIYGERRFEDMPILADALEDAGCTNTDIIAHCRESGPHVRGCWVLDLILGKS